MTSKSIFRAAGFRLAGAVAVAAGIALAAGTTVQATDPVAVQLADATKMAAVKERQELMKSIGGNMKTLTEYVKGEGGHSAEAAETAAMKINELAGRIPAAFETEASLSEMDAVGKNRGKPEIWLMWDEFVESAKTLETKSADLAGVIKGGDMAAVQAAFGDMGKNGCGGCHEEFRGPKVE